jgi:hypothetical protein
MAFVVVNTRFAMNNTVDTICTELDVLLQALSDAMARVNSCGCMRFVTNITSFDGEACNWNMCPQCNASLVYYGTMVTASRRRGRRLFGSITTTTTGASSVDLVTVSTSIDPVPLSVIQNQSNSPAVSLQSELTASLAVVAPNLVPSGVLVAVVSSVAVQPILILPLQRRSAPESLVGWVVRGVLFFMLLVCLAVCAVCSRHRSTKTRVEKDAHVALGVRTEGAGAAWMPAIGLNQRRSVGGGGVDV